ncbi:hypothetical protein [Sphingopyxis sp. NFH-91]|uniref:hypothetical protein n=1 Tax=Sphingopyxis sp. NFH-91 TaxID=2744457 RepID=UPI001F355F6E|nr:hypothetical protein [Sphingopyxis sp. NFH-91]
MTGERQRGGVNEPGQIRLSETLALLSAAGVGEVDWLGTLAAAGLRGQLVATAFQSITVGQQYSESPDRRPVRRMMWRVLSSPKAIGARYRRMISGEDLVWNRGTGGDDFEQEAWRTVFIDTTSLDALLRAISARAPGTKITPAETAAWIGEWPGSNGKTAWQAYQAHFGSRAGKRDDDFLPAWQHHHGRSRGRPKKSPRGQ